MQNKFQYIYSLFKKIYSVNNPSIGISYGLDNHSRIQIRKGNIGIFEKKEAFKDESSVILKIWKNMEIPFFFDQTYPEIITRENDSFIINYDIIASSFFLLSGWNEYFSEKKDQYGRFPYSESIQTRMGITQKPVVNYYFDILKTVIEEAYSVKLNGSKWGEHDFVTCITHDVDTCETGWLEGGFHALKKKDIIAPVRLVFKKIFLQDAWFNFREILKLENDLNVHSTFFFLGYDKPRSGIKNADYDITSEKFRKIFNEIVTSGSEAGLHASALTHKDISLFNQDLNRMNHPVNGVRFHFLLYDHQITPFILDEAGMKYDSSLGFAEQFGFRNSFCFPFQPYDIRNDKPFDFYEIPLVLMDGTLQKYLSRSPLEAMNNLSDLILEIKKFNGCFTFLWHNTHFSEYKYAGWNEVFFQISELCKKENSLFLTCSGLVNTFKNE
jgi:hypothetical protein